MLPGKKYSLDDALRIVRQRAWLLIVPCAIGAALAAARTRNLPNMYQAETVIMVVPQTVPENFVQPIITTRIEDRLPTLRTTILSRTRLERIIDQFKLYPELRRLGPMQDAVEVMRNEISTDVAGGNSFRVSYRGEDPVQVRNVTDSLASLFIDESISYRQRQADGTNEFLDSRLVEAKAKLQEYENRLAAWKSRYTGELPTQVDANLSQIQTMQMALRDLREGMTGDRNRRLELERQLGDLQNPTLVTEALASANPATEQTIASATANTAQLLAVAEAQVRQLSERGLKPGHPDLDTANRRVRELRNRLQGEIAGVQSTTSGSTLSLAEQARRARIETLKRDIQQLDGQLARAQQDEQRLQASMADAQRRVEAAPRRETELIELNRDYEIIKRSYETLLSNKQQAETAATLERRQIGEQFAVLDPAQLPERPVSPNRPAEILFGLVAGLALGAGLVGLLEYRDRGFKTDEDIAGLLDLPVLAQVPVMKSDADVRRSRWRFVLVSAACGSVAVGCLAFAAYVAVS